MDQLTTINAMGQVTCLECNTTQPAFYSATGRGFVTSRATYREYKCQECGATWIETDKIEQVI